MNKSSQRFYHFGQVVGHPFIGIYLTIKSQAKKHPNPGIKNRCYRAKTGAKR